MNVIILNTDNSTFVARFADVKSAEAYSVDANYNAYFVGTPQDLDKFSGVELASIYNSVKAKEHQVKKFETKGVALDRTWTAIQNANAPVKRVAKAQGTERCDYDETHRIGLLVEANPRRKATGNGFKNWLLYKDGMAVADYLNEREKREDIGGGLCAHLYYDVQKGYIEILPSA